MPFKDGTGPTGQGPHIGRGMGNCAGQGSTRLLYGMRRGKRRGGHSRDWAVTEVQATSCLQELLNELASAIQQLGKLLVNSR
jgi:hypothetical protein